jgi:HD-like signal output (HDOD) protein
MRIVRIVCAVIRMEQLPNTKGANARKSYASIPTNDHEVSAREELLRKVSEDTDLPALGSSVSRVVDLASSSDEAVSKLAYLVLSDVGLTQKILRMSNAVVYRNGSGTPVTTVSKAIFLLGFDAVKTSALAMLLVDGMAGKRGQSVKMELAHALGASVFARELARRSHFKDAEEAAVAALFKNIGKVLVAAHDHALYKEIALLMKEGESEAKASLKVIGCTYAMLSDSVLQEWKIPDSIVQALMPVPAGTLRAPKNRQEWMQQVVAFSTTAAGMLAGMDSDGHADAMRQLALRFGDAMNLDEEKLSELFIRVAQETKVLTVNANLPALAGAHASMAELSPEEAQLAADDEAAYELEHGLPSELLMLTADSGALRIEQRHASGKPVNARDLLLAGVQDVTEMMTSGQRSVNDLILLVLETLYRSLGFRFATVCLKDVKTGSYRARIALGESSAARQAGFTFPIAATRDLFHLAMENDADLLISDATEPKIKNLLPAWHRALMPDARSFIVLPLVVHKRPLGLFYADRLQVATEGVPTDEAALIKTLKGQVLTMLNAR